MNGHHATFGSFNTPISPGEALSRFSPLRHYGISPLRPAKRTTSSRWRYEDKNWWVEEGKATVFTRSVSASAIAPTVASQQTCNTGCFAHERLANLRNRISDDQYLERPGGYSAEQLAGYNLYNMKSKRLSSHEYGVNGPSMPLPVSPVSPQTPTRVDLPPRIVELEGSPPMASPSTFQNPPISTAMYADYPASHTTSPTKHANAITIARKPVGSGISPKMSRTSDPLLIWTLESSKTPRIAQTRSPREIKHQYVRSYDDSATPYNRQEYAGQTQWEMDATRTSSQGTSASPTTIRHTNTRLRPSVRFRGDTLQELQPAIAEVESPYLSQYLQKRSTPPTRSPPLQHHRSVILHPPQP